MIKNLPAPAKHAKKPAKSNTAPPAILSTSLIEGTRVRISGLASKPELNGTFGKVAGPGVTNDRGVERYPVLTRAATGYLTNLILLQPKNIQPTLPDPAENATESSAVTPPLLSSEQAEQLLSHGATLKARGDTYGAAQVFERLHTMAETAKASNQARWVRSVDCAALSNLGTALMQSGHCWKAIEHITAALKISIEMGDRHSESSNRGNLGSTYMRLGQHEKAIELITVDLAIKIELGDRLGEGWSRGNLGAIYMELAQYENAVEYLTAALAISLEIGDQIGENSHRRNLGNICIRLCQFKKAVEYMAAGLAISIKRGDRSGEAECRRMLSSLYTKLGQYEKGMEHTTASLEISIAIGDRRGEAECRRILSSVYVDLGKYEKGMEHTRASLEISMEIGDRRGEVDSRVLLGQIYSFLGQPEKGIEHMTTALEISIQIGDRRAEGRCQRNLGRIYINLDQRMDHFWKSVEHSTAGLQISMELGNRDEEASSRVNLGIAYFKFGGYEKAIDYSLGALEISIEIGSRVDEAGSRSNLGNAYMSLGQYEEAIQHFTGSLEICIETGNRYGEAAIQSSLGSLFLTELSDAKTALPWLQQAFATWEGIWNGIADGADDQKVAFGDTFGPVLTGRLLQLALFRLNQPKQALEYAECSSSRAFKLLLARQQLSAGVQNVETARAVDAPLDFSTLQAVAVRQQTAIVVYSHDRRVLTNDKSCNREVLAWVLRSSDGALTSRLLTVPAEDTDALDSGSRRRRNFITPTGDTRNADEKHNADAMLSSLTQLVELTRRTLRVQPRHVDAKGRLRAMGAPNDHFADALYVAAAKAVSGAYTVAEIREALSLNVEQEETRCHGNQAKTNSKDGTEVVTAAAAEGSMSPEKKVSIRESVADSCLRRCHQLLIEPLNDVLAHEPRLLIVPDADLYALPFAALKDAEGKYLIEHHMLTVAPSIGTIIELEQRMEARVAQTSGPSALVVGNPDFNGWADQLQHAAQEAEQVHDDLKPHCEAARLWKGSDATKQKVKQAMTQSTYIHLATHGDPDGVYLSAPTKEEGKLSMAEVQQLELQHAKLVVLSECDSFKGKLSTDGVVGITRAFVAAGAPTVLASLWKVDDKATRALMRRFYRLLLGETAGDPAVALQQAMIAMINERFAVNEWASFVVYGLAQRAVDVDKARIAVPEELVSAAAARRSTDTVFTGGI